MKNKKYDRFINTFVKKFNKSIEKDELWRGRFVLRQIRKAIFDGSCAYLYIAIDKKTGQFSYCDWVYVYSRDTYVSVNRLWHIINNFIINDVKVWEEDPNPYAAAPIDYTKTPVPKKLWNKKYNLTIDYN